METNSAQWDDFVTAVNYARSQPQVSVISISLAWLEFSGENNYDNLFTTPAGHTPITFVSSTGDDGQTIQYPATSPNVVAVGGTLLSDPNSTNGISSAPTNEMSSYFPEAAWNNSDGSSTGGFSAFEGIPSYQDAVQPSGTQRGVPDVSYNADFFSVYNSNPRVGTNVGPGWDQGRGTSEGAPQWAALVAIADSERASLGEPTLGSSDTLNAAVFPAFRRFQ